MKLNHCKEITQKISIVSNFQIFVIFQVLRETENDHQSLKENHRKLNHCQEMTPNILITCYLLVRREIESHHQSSGNH